MRVFLKTDGGFAYIPGLNKPVELDSEKLSSRETRHLHELIQDAGFFDLPKEVGKVPKGAADYQRYTITVEDEQEKHTVKTTDLADNEALMGLISFVQNVAAQKSTSTANGKHE
ncbi:MAG TPA: protealysin inhibitor emfourin [Phototrophicaceae bacterium]|jgi:hypothetical protein|nr:protealysin inhibitor emfourin [Phototrophicaceae bacterium]